ncbi:tRNA threonylcarbamoyladenosine dehydratase [Moraxella marmotae]|uniref:tRNA threonylcarbamoyladenosine dehydratase n=1 Tax=Moraxella marmotae TaxID=3344520 RepID=UPI0035F3E400
MDYERRFMGVGALYGVDALDKFANAIVYVIGVGGVGSWVAESLARTAIGHIVLVDMDILVESNINRQLPASSQTLGESKIDVMAARIQAINPAARIECVDEFLTTDNIQQILPDKATVAALQAAGKTVVVLDCVDDMTAKLAIALHCRFHKIKCVIAGGMGAKIDPTRLKIADLKDASYDPLLARLRAKLREKGIAKGGKHKFGLKCVYSDEPPKTASTCQTGLNCGGYGSAVVVTASAGMVMASAAFDIIARQ